jgi:hypothetical protein
MPEKVLRGGKGKMRAFVANRVKRIADILAGRIHHRGNYDVVALAHYQAGLQSAKFYTENLLNAAEFRNHDDMLTHAANLSRVEGLYLEFGVATGRTINVIAGAHSGPVYGFDSFAGLPEAWWGKYGRGSFARSSLPSVAENVTLVPGWFTDTLPAFLAQHPGPIAFLHIDCDLYSSASFVLMELRERIIPGTVIQFDEYFNYPGWEQHEHRAFAEFVEITGLQFRYDSFLRASQPICVVIEEAR